MLRTRFLCFEGLKSNMRNTANLVQTDDALSVLIYFKFMNKLFMDSARVGWAKMPSRNAV